MIVTVFRSRLRQPLHEEYGPTAERMEQRARAMSGFVDFKGFTADDGERVSLVVFESMETQRAWREDPEHREAQRRGREEFYETYTIQVCELLDERTFTR